MKTNTIKIYLHVMSHQASQHVLNTMWYTHPDNPHKPEFIVLEVQGGDMPSEITILPLHSQCNHSHFKNDTDC